jgi:hypothetical protein
VLVVTVKSKAPKKVTFKEKKPQGKGTPSLAKGGKIQVNDGRYCPRGTT